MNLRIEENALRFRLSRADVEVLSHAGALECPVPGAFFMPPRFGLKLCKDADHPRVSKQDNCLSIIIPGVDWLGLVERQPSKNGLVYSIPIQGGGPISINIEIDVRKR